ncbi:MAG: hypothetical protein P0S95_00630 [Rhabdochlamydiaceae bacterium]|nr:hypothetical protein [Candidatus Amphrikana amoebophyrae]
MKYNVALDFSTKAHSYISYLGEQITSSDLPIRIARAAYPFLSFCPPIANIATYAMSAIYSGGYIHS